MNLRPLTGRVLVEIIDGPRISPGGIAFPDHTKSADEVQAGHANPQKDPAETAIVRGIGPWPKLSNGMALMPEFGVGARVLVSPYRGVQMSRDVNERYRMVENDDVLAVLNDDNPPRGSVLLVI